MPVTVEGKGLLIDTGSSRSAISSETARRLDRQPVAATVRVTPSGRIMRPLARLDGIRLGTAPPVPLLATILPDDGAAAGMAIDGVIGPDVLARLTFTIDYARERIVWRSADAQIPGTRLALDFDRGRFLVTLPQRSSPSVRPLRFVPDSGAESFVLFARPDSSPLPVTPRDTALLTTPSGRRVVRSVLTSAISACEIRSR